MVDVVQLVEHRIVVPSVVGSSPIIHPTKSETFRGLAFLLSEEGEDFALFDFGALPGDGDDDPA